MMFILPRGIYITPQVARIVILFLIIIYNIKRNYVILQWRFITRFECLDRFDFSSIKKNVNKNGKAGKAVTPTNVNTLMGRNFLFG